MQEWTKKLCFMDSDGDGRHNGIELGDPWCQWTKENNYPLQLATSHPGSLALTPNFGVPRPLMFMIFLFF